MSSHLCIAAFPTIGAALANALDRFNGCSVECFLRAFPSTFRSHERMYVRMGFSLGNLQAPPMNSRLMTVVYRYRSDYGCSFPYSCYCSDFRSETASLEGLDFHVRDYVTT